MSLFTQWKRSAKGLINPGVLVLMYHRVADVAFDPWDLCVSPAYFEEQLAWLRQTGRVISMQQFIRDWQSGRLTNGRVVLTFDDGYLDNFTTARPLLEQYDLPATFFISTQPVIEQHPFWWDQLEYLICETPILPQQLSITIEEDSLVADLGVEAELTHQLVHQLQPWRAMEPTQSTRLGLYLALWKRLRPLAHDRQQHYLSLLQAWAGVTKAGGVPLLKSSHLSELATHSLIELGAHTVTHAALGDHLESVQRQEIIGSRRNLEGLCNRRVDTFAYPYGYHNETTRRLLQREGFTLGFTTQATVTTRRSDAYQAGRFQVCNWTGKQLQNQLNPFL